MNTNGQIRNSRVSYEVTRNLEGENWAGLPVGYSYHLWLFIKCLTPSERDILIYLISCNRGRGIYPKYETITNHTGISAPNLSRYITSLSADTKLICPICRFSSNAVEILIPRKKGKSLSYTIKPFLEFIKHMNNHWENENNLYLMVRKRILSDRKVKYLNTIFNFEKNQNG